MPIIAVSNPKGGAGKSTTTLLLSTYLAEQQASVCIIDADPQQELMVDWKRNRATPPKVTIVGGVSEENIVDVLKREADRHQFIFLDLEGTASVLVSRAIMMANYVIIPIQCSRADARQASKAIHAVESGEKLVRNFDPKRRIPYRILLTRTSAPGAPVNSIQRTIEAEIMESGLPRFKNNLAERISYKAVFAKYMTLYEMETLTGKEKVGNLETAELNVVKIADELVTDLGAER